MHILFSEESGSRRIGNWYEVGRETVVGRRDVVWGGNWVKCGDAVWVRAGVTHFTVLDEKLL